MGQGNHRPLFGRFLFLVRMAGFSSADFQECTGLKANIAIIEYWEGGALVAQKEPGRVTFDNITLSRGVSYDRDFYEWIKQVIDIRSHSKGTGEVSPKFKKLLKIQQLERNRQPVIDYWVHKALPASWSPGDFNNDTDELAIDSLELAMEWFERNDLGPAAP